jgi:maleate cis-trans isomerase
MMKALGMAEGKVDGILFSGGGLRTFEIIEQAERDSGLPVVTGGQAGFWRSLRLAGIPDVVPDLGTLFRH